MSYDHPRVHLLQCTALECATGTDADVRASERGTSLDFRASPLPPPPPPPPTSSDFITHLSLSL